MFGGKDKPKVGIKVANSFDTSEVKWSLTGEWLTVALSRFDQTFTSRYDRRDTDFARAIGVVHFGHDSGIAIPVELTLLEDRAAERGKVGVAHYNSQNRISGDGTELITLELTVNDKGNKVANALQEAFTSAAVSEERFVYVTFKRAKLDPNEFLTELVQQRYGAYHDLLEIEVRRRTHLAKTPEWSWAWKREF